MSAAVELISVTCCPACGGTAQAIAPSRPGLAATYRHIETTPLAVYEAMEELLRLLGLGDHPRQKLAHTTIRQEIVPQVRALVQLREAVRDISNETFSALVDARAGEKP